MSDQAYFESEFYQCVVATTAGQSPTTTPASWLRVQVPQEWRRVLARLTYANLLEIDGQTEKASVERARGQSWLDDLTRRDANEEEEKRQKRPVLNC